MGIVPVGFKEAEKMLEGIKKGYPRAAKEAINKGLQVGKTTAVEEIGHRYVMSASKTKAGIKVNPASTSRLKGNLDINGDMQPISWFKPVVRYTQGAYGPRRQVISVTIIRGHTKVLKGAFRIPDGRIMERRQSDRFPIFPVSTIGIAHMAGQRGISKIIEKNMNETTSAVMKKTTEQFLLKSGGKKTA